MGKAKGNDLGEMLVAALEEAVEIKSGGAPPAHLSQVPISASTAEVEPPPDYSASRIRNVRRSMMVSQAIFAEMLNVSSSTVAAWEQGERHPRGATLRLLELAEHDPRVLASRVRLRQAS